MSDSPRSSLGLSDGDYDDRYEIKSKIGWGAFAEVMEARDKATNTLVALKKINKINDPQMIGIDPHALREIGILNLLADSDAPSVVKLLSVEYSGGKVTEVLEFMDTDLTTVINRKPLPPDQIRSFMRQLLEGVAAFHALGVLHRDLKPDNLLVDKEERVLKIADLDNARAFTDRRREHSLEVGSALYTAPEILLGSPTYSTGVDMWSVGCIFAEMSTGTGLIEVSKGLSEIENIFRLFGTPTEETWPGVTELPKWRDDFNNDKPTGLRDVGASLGPAAVDLMKKLVTYDPTKRISARAALQHDYFVDVEQ